MQRRSYLLPNSLLLLLLLPLREGRLYVIPIFVSILRPGQGFFADAQGGWGWGVGESGSCEQI